MTISCVFRRGLSLIRRGPSSALITRLSEAVNRWPVDPTKEDRDVRLHLERRLRDAIDGTYSTQQIEKDIICLERLTANEYRDRYPTPAGLGGPPPNVAATGLDLPTISKILAGSDAIRIKRSIPRLFRIIP